MNKAQVVQQIIGKAMPPRNAVGSGFAPANIALAKYWGKRSMELNLPVTNSLSISLGDRGSHTQVALHPLAEDVIFLNGEIVAQDSKFSQALIKFLDLFRPDGYSFRIDTHSNIPIAAGVASSASGFAAVTLALNHLFAWDLPLQQLSMLARLGSGSASRSLWPGFVEWHAGVDPNGADSFAEPLPYQWPELRIGLLLFSSQQKPISSRDAMAVSMETSPFYPLWPSCVATAIDQLKTAIVASDFASMAATAESNALAMHALMMTGAPAIIYSTAATIAAQQAIWQARKDGLQVYFTQDAGANLKLLFLAQDAHLLQQLFPSMEIICPWQNSTALPAIAVTKETSDG